MDGERKQNTQRYRGDVTEVEEVSSATLAAPSIITAFTATCEKFPPESRFGPSKPPEHRHDILLLLLFLLSFVSLCVPDVFKMSTAVSQGPPGNNSFKVRRFCGE